jgi:hypothetical protein
MTGVGSHIRKATAFTALGSPRRLVFEGFCLVDGSIAIRRRDTR